MLSFAIRREVAPAMLSARCLIGILAASLSLAFAVDARAQIAVATTELDRKVQSFLDAQRGSWDHFNVPYEDGRILHELVVKGGYKRILEIGTSTGHSTLWLAWAAAKTGGRVTTIEIDRGRHERALHNLRRAGLAQYVDARFADAHDLVKALPGPWDFVFQDADKEWYLQYFLDLEAKLAPSGCYTAHNVARPYARQVTEFLGYARTRPGMSFRFATGASAEGISVSCRTR